MENINEIIDNICLKLGTTAEFLIPEYAKMRIAESILSMVAFAALTVATVCVMKFFVKAVKPGGYFYENDIEDIASLIGWGVLLICVVIFLIAFFDSACCLLRYVSSPTAAFIKEMLRSIMK